VLRKWLEADGVSLPRGTDPGRNVTWKTAVAEGHSCARLQFLAAAGARSLAERSMGRLVAGPGLIGGEWFVIAVRAAQSADAVLPSMPNDAAGTADATIPMMMLKPRLPAPAAMAMVPVVASGACCATAAARAPFPVMLKKAAPIHSSVLGEEGRISACVL
jgi:hypothetical protein